MTKKTASIFHDLLTGRPDVTALVTVLDLSEGWGMELTSLLVLRMQRIRECLSIGMRLIREADRLSRCLVPMTMPR